MSKPAIAARPTLDEIRSWPATVEVETAAPAVGVSRSTAYEWIRRGEFPAKVISVRGRRLVVTASLIDLLAGDSAAGVH